MLQFDTMDNYQNIQSWVSAVNKSFQQCLENHLSLIASPRPTFDLLALVNLVKETTRLEPNTFWNIFNLNGIITRIKNSLLLWFTSVCKKLINAPLRLFQMHLLDNMVGQPRD